MLNRGNGRVEGWGQPTENALSSAEDLVRSIYLLFVKDLVIMGEMLTQ